jgi:hypothetical protein
MLHGADQSRGLAQWIKHLRGLAGDEADASRLDREALSRFRDDRGHHRAVDLPFLAHRAGHVLEQRPGPTPPAYDVGLWWALHDPSIDVDALIGEPTEGGLFPQGVFQTIEVWTESDLSGIHALWRLAEQRDRDDWRRRIEAVADWHIRLIQPDNGTNHPWATHVFLLRSEHDGGRESMMHAETLVSNTMVTFGRPDTFSRHILGDCADALEWALRHQSG